MPRFFFHVRDTEQVMWDPEGSIWPDVAAAVRDAATSALWLMGTELKMGQISVNRWFDIADEACEVVATVAFKNTLFSSVAGGVREKDS